MKKKFMKAEEFDKKLDNGEDVSEFFYIENAKRPGREQKRVNVYFPIWMINSLIKKATNILT